MAVTLRNATPADRRAVFEWMAQSDLTASMMGPPEFAENPVPTWEQFLADYLPYFFDGSEPELGRSFIIEHRGKAVGHVSYSQMDPSRSFAELDIWMRDSSCCGRGHGRDALVQLSEHLHSTFGVRELILRPSARNIRAVRAYAAAGFEVITMPQEEQALRYGAGEYHDTALMRRVWP
jgi:RimJ/RimL family protein N-acetyltransferase